MIFLLMIFRISEACWAANLGSLELIDCGISRNIFLEFFVGEGESRADEVGDSPFVATENY